MSSRSGIKKKSSSLARAVAPAQSKPALSALGQLIELLEESTGCRISFENLTGVSFHVEDLALPSRLRIHTCEACMFAKSRRETHADCIRNKTAVNRLATRRKKMFSGQCHIGLTELVAPLMYQGRVMGVFFLGSVVVRETATEARRKLRRYCETQGLDSRPFLAALAKAPQISAQEIPGLEARSSSSGGCIKIGKNCLCTIDKTGATSALLRRSIRGSLKSQNANGDSGHSAPRDREVQSWKNHEATRSGKDASTHSKPCLERKSPQISAALNSISQSTRESGIGLIRSAVVVAVRSRRFSMNWWKRNG